ncbi:hypothetical protein CFK37_09630 [Virgibacillus phasianinus]|uniref:Aryl sulfotransferase n=2 Tax=Virgibacillus phasianinus TaxID=2017483 RepID=A0A220U7T5_9BACI|nr:hypothetical protein CFK37_09630 [Virgibacillus phasianinus]
MKVTVNVNKPGTAPGFIFVAPYEYYSTPTVGQTGSLIMDQAGNPVWFRPSDKYTQNRDFKAQSYYGHPVLTLWQGTIAGTLSAHPDLPQGEPLPGAYFQIINQHYQVIRTITAKKGYTADNHEFIITKRNTALFLAIKHVPADLSPFGGPREGYIRNYSIQEINPETNELVFFWDALSHVNPGYSNVPASSAMESHNIWDPFHLNSVEEGPDTTLLISMRDMWGIYNIDKRTGNIIWQLGGKQSDFTFDSNATFSWQHHARYRSGTKISLFNNACCGATTPPEGTSHGLILQLDYTNMTAKECQSYYHDPALYVDHQGNMQQLPNENQFIGWGVKPFLSEFKYAGNTKNNPSLNLIYDMQMPNHTYRAFKNEWVGLPLHPPDIAVETIRKDKSIVFASWNGSTETAAWQVLAGSTPYTMSVAVSTTPRTGFETAIPIYAAGPYFLVHALDSRGRVIGRSRMVYPCNI